MRGRPKVCRICFSFFFWLRFLGLQLCFCLLTGHIAGRPQHDLKIQIMPNTHAKQQFPKALRFSRLNTYVVLYMYIGVYYTQPAHRFAKCICIYILNKLNCLDYEKTDPYTSLRCFSQQKFLAWDVSSIGQSIMMHYRIIVLWSCCHYDHSFDNGNNESAS